MTSLIPLGDSAFLARFESDETATRWADSVRARHESWIVDVVAAYSNVAVFVDPDRVDWNRVEARLQGIVSLAGESRVGRTHTIPVVYDGEDLGEVAARLGLTETQVVVAHCGRAYRVSAIGLNELRDYLDGFWGDVLSAFAAGGERGSDDGERDSTAREDGERGLGTRGRVPKVHRRDVGLVAAQTPLHRPGKRRRVRV
jgi:hypothetical protein